MAKRTNKKFRHILAQEGLANNIKAMKHVKKASRHARKTIKHARKQDKAINVLGKIKKAINMHKIKWA